jgi:hypothetical protein
MSINRILQRTQMVHEPINLRLMRSLPENVENIFTRSLSTQGEVVTVGTGACRLAQ